MRSSLVHSVPGNLVGTVDGRVVEGSNDPVANGLQSSMEQRLDSMMAAIQSLSDRMINYKQNGGHSKPVYPNNSRSPQPSLVLLIHLLMTVAGLRMRGVIVVI